MAHRSAFAALVLLVASLAAGQDSQFLFDANGNLQVQTGKASAPPQIVRQPQSQIAGLGNRASFSVLAASTAGLTYQWRFNGGDISGATGDSLLVSNLSAGNEGQYTVVLSNSSGSTTSDAAMLWFDGNGNGLPDSWEQTYFGNLNQAATGDFDGDGVSNLQEFFDGTNPTNSASVNYHLTLFSDGGTVTLNPNQSAYTNGQMVTLTALPPEAFHAWTGDIPPTHSNSITLAMTTNLTVFAHFRPMDYVWTNLAGGDWYNPTNWAPNLVPGSNDNASITISTTVNLNTNAVCAGLTLGTPNSAAILTGNGTLTVQADSSWMGGTMSGSGRTVVAPGAVLTLAGANSMYLAGRTLENDGTMIQAAAIVLSSGAVLDNVGTNIWTSAAITMGGGCVVTNETGALIDDQTDLSMVSLSGGNRFDNAGLFRKSGSLGTSSFDNGVSFNNYGSVEIEMGTLLCGGTFVNDGTVTLSPGTTNRLGFGGSATGLFDAPATALVEWTSGNFILNPGAQLNGPGLYRLNGGSLTCNTDLSVTNLDLINGSSGLGGTNTVTVTGFMNWNGGGMSGGGRVVISPAATLSISNPSTISINGYTLDNAGTAVWKGPGSWFFGSGIITNRPSAIFEVQNANSWYMTFGGPSRFDNAGLFRKSVDSGILSFGANITFNNYGSADLQTGKLLLTSGGLNSSTIAMSAGAALELSGGTFNSTLGSSMMGAGNLTVSGATLNLAGQADLTGVSTFSSGTANVDSPGAAALAVANLSGATLGGSGVISIGNLMTWSAGSLAGTGRTIIQSPATLSITNPSTIGINGYTLENAGKVLWTGAGGWFFEGGVITNRSGGLFDVQNSSFWYMTFGGPARLDNTGVFRKSVNAGAVSFGANISLNNYGTADVQTGSLNLGGGGLNGGTFTVAAGSGVELSAGTFSSLPSSSMTGAGNLTVSGATANLDGLVSLGGTNKFSSGTANLTGNYLFTNNTVLIPGGTVNFNGSGTAAPATVILSGGNLGGSNTVTIEKVMNWTAGGMSGGGRAVIAGTAMLLITNSSTISLTGYTLDNAGTAVWSGSGGWFFADGIITNRPGATFDVQSSSFWYMTFGGPARFDNAGLLRKSIDPGTTSFGANISLNNFGTVNVRNGILAANGGYKMTDSSVIVSTLAGTSVGAGYGQLQVASAVTLNGALNVDFANGFQPAINNVFTVLKAGTLNGTFASFSYPASLVTMQMSNSSTSVILTVTGVSAPQPILLTPTVSGSNLLLSWTAATNTTYRVEFNPDLNPSNWNALAGDVIATNNLATKLDPLTPTNRFYRLRILP